MDSRSFSERLWGQNSQFYFLLIAAFFILFSLLGAREIWTQEHRWADIVNDMFYYHDFLHPRLNGTEYYDKPLLSYWLIACLVGLTGKMSTWAIRLPSAFAGLLAIYSIYRIGRHVKDKSLGLLSGWLLLTTFYFIFWSRIGNSEMLNLSGILFAIQLYLEKNTQPTFLSYSIFFLILSITSLFKGLVAPAIIFLAIFPHMVLTKTLKTHLLDYRLYLAIIPAIFFYILPFLVSLQHNEGHYLANGLAMVYRENIIRYFHPFDHQEPFYIYFYYLPIYLLPWTLLLIPTLIYFKQSWQILTLESKWLLWASVLIFIFFTMCGSRRNYYILPMIPFVILMMSCWITANHSVRINTWVCRGILLFYLLLAIDYGLLQPFFYAKGGVNTFKSVISTHIPTGTNWNYVLLDAQTKVRFYLNLTPKTVNYGIKGPREQQTIESLKNAWPILNHLPQHTIIITRRFYEPFLQDLLKNFTLVEAEPNYLESYFNKMDPDSPIAYIN